MDLKDYERVKFVLAEILRSAALRSRKGGRDGSAVFGDLFARLAEDRFNLVVVGRFNRGKTSLMNALLSTTRLPVGILPLTSVITTVSYGSDESATIEYRGRSIPQRVPLDDLADYVTERGNPGNVREVTTARIQLSAELLRRGFHFIDTPGIGSAIAENTRTTRDFLPEADAVLLVTSYDSPLSEDEMNVIEVVRRCGRRLFFIVNKEDLVTDDERADVLEHVRSRVHAAGIAEPEVFSVSARGGFAYGIADLAHHLTRYLVEEKQAEFIRVMCERIQDVLDAFPGEDTERRNLRAIAKMVGGSDTRERATTLDRNGIATKFSTCPICALATHSVVSFLMRYQFELISSLETRTNLAEIGGFCELHTWQYDALAGPRGACISLSTVLEHAAERLHYIASESRDDLDDLSEKVRALLSTKERCPACRVRSESERVGVDTAVLALDGPATQGTQAYCLTHFLAIVNTVPGRTVALRLIESQADAFENVAEDMRRYIVKFDGTRRYLMDLEERDAGQRGLALLAGSRGINGVTRDR